MPKEIRQEGIWQIIKTVIRHNKRELVMQWMRHKVAIHCRRSVDSAFAPWRIGLEWILVYQIGVAMHTIYS